MSTWTSPAVGDAIVARQPHPWRDTIEGLISAVILVLIIRHFTFEVFKIPTGSMAPTLLGQHRDIICPNCGLHYAIDRGFNDQGQMNLIYAECPNCGYELTPESLVDASCKCFPSWPRRLFGQGGNRVIVNKFACRYCPPKRWDIIVFRFPFLDVHCWSCGARFQNVSQPKGHVRCAQCGSWLVTTDQKAFIKRLTGLPGEEITVRHGDIFANGVLQRKPPEVQKAVWRLVYDSAHVPKEPVRKRPTWVIEAGEMTEEKEGALRLRPSREGVAQARYGARIEDFTAYNGRKPGEAWFPVGDLQWDARVKLEGDGVLRLGIVDDDTTFTAALAFGGQGRKTALEVNGKVVKESDFRADAAGERRVTFSHVDQRLDLCVDEAPVLSWEYSARESSQAYRSGAFLSVGPAEAEFSRLILRRDLYYAPASFSVRVPSDGYFVMGDNTRNSFDSRFWGGVPIGNLIGRGEVVWWPLGDLRPIR